MQAQSSRPVKTFSIGFQNPGFDEAAHAREVARHLGTDHTELYVTPSEAMAVIPRLPTMYDEPFADSSQIPTFLVSELARRHVTVSLSGDGGDELFAGYNRYLWVQRIWSRIGKLPRGARRAAARALMAMSPAGWDRAFSLVGPVLPEGMRHRQPGYKLHKLAGVLGVGSSDEMFHAVASHWLDAGLVPGAQALPTAFTSPEQAPALEGLVDRMMYTDLVSYLPDDILTKVDRASMSVSLEARVPLLDHRVVEFAWRIPLSFKVRDGQSKWLLRQVLYRHVPRRLIERPKMGFGVPLAEWLRGPLREWAEQLLDARRIRDEGFLNPAPIRARWNEHLAGTRNWEYHLWDILMFQAWLEAQGVASTPRRVAA
jgi:asparagine synthase (glutamine-hydrolysing)